MDQWEPWWRESYRLAHNDGCGLIIQGTREWKDYEVSATIKLTLAAEAGIGARVQAMKRYYGFLLIDGNKARLVKALEGDNVLAETDFLWESEREYHLRLQVQGSILRAWVDDAMLFEVEDQKDLLDGGGVAFILEEGTMMS